MAKTEAEKQATKLKNQARDKAFRARQKAYHQAKKAAVEAVGSSQLGQDAKAANQALEDALRARDAKASALRVQIAELERELSQLDIDPELSLRRKETWQKQHLAKEAAEQKVNDQYPDMVDVYSAVQWEQRGHFKYEA